jgi:inner membrane protease subunit 1
MPGGGWLDAVEVRGASMAPALLPGDRLLIESRSLRRRPPRPGEIVVAVDPREPTRELVKRVASVDRAAGTVLLAGDAPDDSTDSRTFGPVPLAEVRWRAVARYWPLGRARLFPG